MVFLHLVRVFFVLFFFLVGLGVLGGFCWFGFLLSVIVAASSYLFFFFLVVVNLWL